MIILQIMAMTLTLIVNHNGNNDVQVNKNVADYTDNYNNHGYYYNNENHDDDAVNEDGGQEHPIIFFDLFLEMCNPSFAMH